MLVLRDLQARSRQAYLGYLWLVVQPLLMTGAFSFLVQRVLGRGDQSDVPYPLFLLAALVPWQFFANSLTDSAESLVKNVDLVRQVFFPREILAIYPIFARLVDVLVGCLVLAVFMVYFHVPPSGWVMLVPPILLIVMLYAVPVLYPLEAVPTGLRPIYDLNPLAHLVDAFRAAVLGTHAPDLVGLGLIGLLGILALVAAQRVFSVFDGVLAD